MSKAKMHSWFSNNQYWQLLFIFCFIDPPTPQ